MGYIDDNYQYYGRVGHVEIDSNGKTMSFDGLDFKFRVSKTIDGYAKGFVDVSVLGLSREKINSLTSLCNIQDALSSPKRVRVYAGYATKGENLIIDADITYAYPSTPPPEVWFSIQGIQGYRYMRPGISCSEMGPVRFEDLFNSCVKTMSNAMSKEYGSNGVMLKGDFRASKKYGDIMVEGFSHNGCIYDLIGKLSEITDVMCFIDNGDDNNNDLIVAVDKGKVSNSGMVGSRVKKLSVKTGMIGMPSLKESVMLDCRCLLDPYLRVADIVEVESEIIPAISDKYQVTNISHSGHLRGNEWYTSIQAISPARVGGKNNLLGYASK